ncbi:MAG: AraC family transcriptional regulator [Sphaerochaetaceae bacterium]|nr:AraC family transcriptional regulator [Sphaerochaetaceae bacterium]
MEHSGASPKVRPVRFTWARLVLPMVLAAMTLSLVLYQQFERISLNMLERMNRDMTNQSDSIVNYINDMIYASGMQLFYDETIALLRTSGSIGNGTIVEGVRKLDTFGGYSASIQSVYIYNGRQDCFFTTSNVPGASSMDFFDQGVLDVLDQVYPSSRMRPIYRYVPKPYSRGLVEVNTYVLFEEDAGGMFDNAMIVNVHADWLDTVLASFLGETEVLVLNEQGRVIGKTFEINLQQQQEVERLIRTRTSDTGRFIVSGSSGKDLYLYSAFGTTDWCFVRHLGWNELFAELDMMKTYTYAGLFCVLALVSFLGLRNSLRFFMPLKRIADTLQKSELSADPLQVVEYVDKLVVTSHTAKTVEKNYIRHLRAEYLRQLLDKDGGEFENICVEFSMYEVPFRCDEPFSLLLLSMNGEALLSDIERIADSCCSVQMNNRAVCFLQGEVDCPMLEQLCIHYGCYCSLGEPIRWTDDIRLSFGRIEEGLSYHMFPTTHELIYREWMLNEKYSSLPNKLNLEPQILSSLAQAKLDDAFLRYKEYRDAISLCRFSYIVFTLKRLYLASLGHPDSVDEHVLERLDLALKVQRDSDAVDMIFWETFKQRVEEILKSKESRVGLMLDRVRQIIERDHGDVNLSVQSVADELSLSSVYLGKVFRTNTGHSIAEEINICRLEYARRLLAETDLSVRQVAIQAGFPNSQYFFTLFRKAMNQTPAQYRELERGEAGQ